MDQPINWNTFFFLLFALTTCLFSVAVLVTNNIVRMAFYLTICLGATSGLFFLAGADFVGAMQLMIYVGGTLVLLIFGVMLTAQGPFVSMKARGGDWVVAAVVGGALMGLLVMAAASVPAWQGPSKSVAVHTPPLSPVTGETAEEQHEEAVAEHDLGPIPLKRTASEIGLDMLGVRPDTLDSTEPAENMGRSGYLLPFEIVSMHLLVVLVGAAYLARTKKRGKG